MGRGDEGRDTAEHGGIGHLRTVEYMPEKERAAARPCRALRYVRVCHQLGMNYRFGY
jgi:hypothetical protein